VTIRTATNADIEPVVRLTLDAYVSDGFETPESPCLNNLVDAAARFRHATLLVAELQGSVVGAVMFVVHGTPYATISGPGECEVRLLAVAPSARGHGLGKALVQECVALAYRHNSTVLRLSSRPEMTAARRIYAQLGFARTPDRDWVAVPGEPLLTYALNLRAYDERSSALEPPRICGACGRRMIVQVTPKSWTARCSAHGVRSG
jgi:ribosomal protein S18 acetylase RimI-like enzyme